MLFARDCLRSVGPGGPTVSVPGEFEDAGRAPDPLHSAAGAEGPGTEIADEGGDGLTEAAAPFGSEAVVVGDEAAQGVVGRQIGPPGSTTPRQVPGAVGVSLGLNAVGDVVVGGAPSVVVWRSGYVGVRWLTVESSAGDSRGV